MKSKNQPKAPTIGANTVPTAAAKAAPPKRYRAKDAVFKNVKTLNIYTNGYTHTIRPGQEFDAAEAEKWAPAVLLFYMDEVSR